MTMVVGSSLTRVIFHSKDMIKIPSTSLVLRTGPTSLVLTNVAFLGSSSCPPIHQLRFSEATLASQTKKPRSYLIFI